MGPSDASDADAVTDRGAYDVIVADLVGGPVTSSAMFGMPCLKVAGKAFSGHLPGAMVFKLRGADHAAALALPGAHLFDPSGRGRPMREWVVVPAAAASRWSELAQAASRAVGGLDEPGSSQANSSAGRPVT